MADEAMPVSEAAPSAGSAPEAPSVLVVDDNKGNAERCAHLLDALHYRNLCVHSARDALERIAQDPTIGIVVAAVEMASFDGFVLIEEARDRIGEGRTLAAILMADRIDAALAMRGMHVGASDLLQKPVAMEAWSAALRRAMRSLDRGRNARGSHELALLNERILALSETLGSSAQSGRSVGAAGDKEVAAALRQIIASRSQRARYFPTELFADPAWDILLDLTRARLENQQVSVSSVCIAASVPMSTALRWVRQMTEAGLLRRWTDPKDRRRDLIALTDTTAERMRDYLATVYSSLRTI